MPARRLDHEASAHQQALAMDGRRKELGAWYTPPDVVDGLLRISLDPLLAERARAGADAVAALRVLDPACGSGNFLVAAGERIAGVLVGLGVGDGEARRQAFGRCVAGRDVDPVAARLCRRTLRAASGGALDAREAARQVVVVSDALVDARAPIGSFDLVVGNPPFLSQLDRRTARSPAVVAELRDRYGSAVSAYTDQSALFLLLGLELARPDGGVVCLVQPVSLLSSRDAAGVRAGVRSAGSLAAVWVAGELVFDAAVAVCAPVVVRGGPAASATVAVARGRDVVPIAGSAELPASGDGSWAAVLALTQGVPDRTFATAGTVADLASASADFRDQYYGLVGHVVDEVEGDPARPRLVTVGLIEPNELLWGRRPTSFARQRFTHPRVAVADLDAALQAWAARRLVPKVLVATQTKVLEAVVDVDGALLPSVPVVTVEAPASELWRVAAVLASPPATLVAARRHLGAGRNEGVLKLSAREVLELPLPAHRGPWDRAADLLAGAAADRTPPEVRRAALVAAAEAMGDAYGAAGDDELLAWWSARLPRAVSAGPRSGSGRAS